MRISQTNCLAGATAAVAFDQREKQKCWRGEGAGVQHRGCGHRQAASLAESNTLYSAQECLNRRALARGPDKEASFRPCRKQSKAHQKGGISAQGLGQVTLASTG